MQFLEKDYKVPWALLDSMMAPLVKVREFPAILASILRSGRLHSLAIGQCLFLARQ
jgi:hypothetical protein